MNEKTFTFNPNSKIFRSWQENSNITETEFVEALGWLHDDPRDESGRMTREIGLSPTGILRLTRSYTDDGRCCFYHNGELWNGEHFSIPCRTEKEKRFSTDGENLITFHKITLSPDDLKRHMSEFFPNPNHMGNNLKSLRIRAGLTQKELAEKTGITQGKISTYEQATNLSNITLGNIYRIAAALSVTIDEIIKEETIMDIREKIIDAIVDTTERAMNGNIGNYYSAYITREGRIYIDEETDSNTMPEAVYSGRDRIICSVQSAELWGSDEEKYDTYASYLDEEQQTQLADYIESEKDNYDYEARAGIEYIETTFPDIAEDTDSTLKNDILNDLRYRLENGTSEYEETISEIVEWVDAND